MCREKQWKLDTVGKFFDVDYSIIVLIRSLLLVINYQRPSSNNSVQHASAETSTPEVTSSGAPSSLVSSQKNSITSASTLTNNYVIYENPTSGISIQYPSSWEKIEYPRMGLAPVGIDLVANFLVP